MSKDISAASLFSKGIGQDTAKSINNKTFVLGVRQEELIRDNLKYLKEFLNGKRVHKGTTTLFVDGVCNIASLCDVSNFFHLSTRGSLQILNLEGKIIKCFGIDFDIDIAANFISKYIQEYVNTNVSAYFINFKKEKIYL